MFRISRLVALTCVVLFAMTAAIQAGFVPMVYNNSTSSPLVSWDMEGDGAPTLGTVSYNYGNNSTVGIVSAASEGFAASEGSQFLKSYRAPGYASDVALNFGSATASGNVTTTTFAIRLKDSNAYEEVMPGTTGSNENMGAFYFLGTGDVTYHNGTWTSTGLTTHIDQWNKVVLRHTNGTGNWSIAINDSPAVNVTITDTANWAQCVSGNLGGFHFVNANDPSTVYIDAVAPVPEPCTLALLATGLMGLLAYAWRKRK